MTYQVEFAIEFDSTYFQLHAVETSLHFGFQSGKHLVMTAHPYQSVYCNAFLATCKWCVEEHAYDIHSIEQPIRQHQWARMAQLCASSPIPIALDEELIGVNMPGMKQELLDTIRPQYIILKPSLHGGISGTREWIDMAHQRGIGSWITSALESNVGLNAVAQLAADVYGPDISMPQGLGTGMLFTDNIEMPLTIRGEKLWRL